MSDVEKTGIELVSNVLLTDENASVFGSKRLSVLPQTPKRFSKYMILDKLFLHQPTFHIANVSTELYTHFQHFP